MDRRASASAARRMRREFLERLPILADGEIDYVRAYALACEIDWRWAGLSIVTTARLMSIIDLSQD